jgi:hypothetical protein
VTSVSRRVASGTTVLESIWVIYAQVTAINAPCSINLCNAPQLSPLYTDVIFGLAAILLVDGLLGTWGAWFAYPIGAALSAILLLLMGYSVWADSGYLYLTSSSYQAAVGAALAAIALVANVGAARAKNRLSEQANPMNLPVFG